MQLQWSLHTTRALVKDSPGQHWGAGSPNFCFCNLSMCHTILETYPKILSVTLRKATGCICGWWQDSDSQMRSRILENLTHSEVDTSWYFKINLMSAFGQLPNSRNQLFPSDPFFMWQTHTWVINTCGPELLFSLRSHSNSLHEVLDSIPRTNGKKIFPTELIIIPTKNND